ncbi:MULTISPECIES: nucleotidyltransferase domain-containing protein [unclassified Fusibacter]|uniref:nucleotidyltransferase domain-containing protein n=1 Tax=unclassified Fusibacter TaxID=2624464 RepID=UPI001011BB45|nr:MULTISPECIES: nucleotidyltransferase domain-containing protein [unclassified Fusibacter]MCK8059003.1 nucleotidyltransferase domain-containing protein [Fusibacter sp. A2]NPE22414.1 nucleotidyltransferase domain-containing protein [Fusibacter sp. A1]RXV60520.1 nucleotidyltransferase domain-containing protein [Fusibacter sp. A1]
MDNYIERLIDYLLVKYKCDTVILYGSYARGDFTAESDVDLVCFRESEIDLNDTGIFEGKQLDVWVMSKKALLAPQDFLHIREGIVLVDKDASGEKLLKTVDDMYACGPEKKERKDKLFLIDWMNKMYLRSTKGDIEGTYRYYWLVRDILEIYFELHDLWYEGPKKSLSWLELNDTVFYNHYEKVLRDKVLSVEMRALIEYLSESLMVNDQLEEAILPNKQ